MKTIFTTTLALSLLTSMALAKGHEGGGMKSETKKESSKIKSKKEKTHQYEQQYKGTGQQNKAQQQNKDKESLEKGKKNNMQGEEAE